MPSGSVTPAGGGGPAAGKYLPVSYPTGATVDTTTYIDPQTGNPATTLVFPASGANEGACFLCVALQGDAGLRWGFSSDPLAGLFIGNGSSSPMGLIELSGNNLFLSGINNADVFGPVASHSFTYPQLGQLSPKYTVTSGALSTVQLVSGTGAQILTSRDTETITPCTFNPGAATTATVTVALSPDNVTYSTLGVETEPAGTALDGTIHLVRVRVPAGWYLKLTANAQAVLGLTTYY